MSRFVLCSVCVGFAIWYLPCPITAGAEANDDAKPESESLSAAEIFDRRVRPILRSDQASSCTECHFAGVELKHYLHDDQSSTFSALRDAGLIDLKAPDQSKILQFISRHGDSTTPLLAKVRASEQQALSAWIRAAVREPDLLSAKSTSAKIGSELPVEVVRHMRSDHVLASFVENIWSEIGRCINCHSPERNQRLVEKHGEQVSWIRPNDPAGTLRQAVEQGIIDPSAPEESLILQKPLVLVKHVGGPKFALGSRTDKNFRRFLNDYAAVVNQRYQRTDQLPRPSASVAVISGQHLRITNLPENLGNELLKVELFAWNGLGWSATPAGIAEGPINGKNRLWQSMVFSTAARGSQPAKELQQADEQRLPAGRYLIKIYIDRAGKSKTNRDYELGPDEFFGQVEINGDWPPGYQPPKIVAASELYKATGQ